MKNYDWRQQQRKSWPDGSLEKALSLNYPGSRSVLEALEKAKAQKPDVSAAQAPLTPSDYDLAREIIEELKARVTNEIYEKLDGETRVVLAKIPTNTIDELRFYRERLFHSIRKVLSGST